MKKPTFAHVEYLVDYPNKQTAQADIENYRAHGWRVFEQYDQEQGPNEKGEYTTYTVEYHKAVGNIPTGW